MLPLFTTKLKIAKTNKVVCVTGSVYGMLTEIRFTFDPLSSILSNEIMDVLLRFSILRESLALIRTVNHDVAVVCLHENGERTVDKIKVDKTVYDSKYKELSKEFEKVREKVNADAFKKEYKKLTMLEALSRSI